MDISEKERKGLLELAMSSLPTGLFICDRDGIIRFINDAYAHYLHLRPEDALGRPITDFIADSGIPSVIASGEAELGAWRQFPISRASSANDGKSGNDDVVIGNIFDFPL